MRFRPVLALSAAALLIGATGCTDTPEPPGDNTAAGLTTVTDLAGREHALELPLHNMVLQMSGSGGPFMTLLALEGKNLPNVLAGIDPGLAMNRLWEWQKITEAVPKLEAVPDVGQMWTDTFSIEQIASLEPDALLITKSLFENNTETIDRLEALGVPSIVIDYHAQTVETHLATIALLGELTGKQDRAAEIAGFYLEQVDPVFTRVADIAEDDKPTVYVELGSQGPDAFSNSYGDTLWGGMIERTGGKNIGTGVILDPDGAPMDAEYLLQQDPDMILITGAYWPKVPDAMRLGYYAEESDSRAALEAFTHRPGWNNLTAVQSGQLYAAHHTLTREVFDGASYQFLAKMFHPELFEDLDPEASLREFHDRFLPYPYSGIFMLTPEHP